MKKLLRFRDSRLAFSLSSKLFFNKEESNFCATLEWRNIQAAIFHLLRMGLLSFVFLLLGTIKSFSQYDLSLTQIVDKDSVGIGDTVLFTLTVMHESGDTAQGVVVIDSLPLGLTFVSAGTPTGGGVVSYNLAERKLTWSLADLDASKGNTSVTFFAKVDTWGVHFSEAEITISPNDADSPPGNKNYLEDDIASACITVPIKICTINRDSVVLTATSGATNVTWYRIYDFGGDGIIDSGDTIQVATSNIIHIDSFGALFFYF